MSMLEVMTLMMPLLWHSVLTDVAIPGKKSPGPSNLRLEYGTAIKLVKPLSTAKRSSTCSSKNIRRLDPQLQNLENQQKSSQFTMQDRRNFDMKIWEVKDTTTDKNTRSLHGAFDCECNKHVELTDAKSIYYMTDPRELIEAGIPAQLMLNEGLEKEEEVMSIQEEQWDAEEDEEWLAMREYNDEDDENELGL